MSSFTKDLTITKIKIDKKRFFAFLFKKKYKKVYMWRVDKSFDYHVGSEESEEIIHIPERFITDGASIPRIFWTLIGHPMEDYVQAAVVHDYLYTSEDQLKNMPFVGEWKVYKYTRRACDYIFYEAMGALDVGKVKRMLMYQAVRRCAGRLWRKRGKHIDSGIE
ncbi:DUF1353 domain-containing protein [Candidatus Pacearchaeota archaeon]|nr:DUF1353 domain-containing protein [Candidatus Pacearchaeota archaeon]